MGPLTGRHVRLEPLTLAHADALLAAAAGDSDLYRWTRVPRTPAEAAAYIETALAQQRAGTAEAFATVRLEDGRVIGSTRFWNLERWDWAPGHERHGRAAPDVCEIGHTWLAPAAIRTAANTEAKQLMLAHAFEVWGVLRVCFHTDARNERSRAAIERIGGRFEGVLRTHRIVAEGAPRDSARYSILISEWPAVKERLAGMAGGYGRPSPP